MRMGEPPHRLTDKVLSPPGWRSSEQDRSIALPGRDPLGSQRLHVQVLVVEDDTYIRSLLADVLADRGHDVTAIGNGEGAWEAYERVRFPLLLLDWSLPGID